MNGLRLIHAGLAALVAATCLACPGVSASAVPTIESFVGEWKMYLPATPCDVTLRIRPDGAMTMTDGANVVESRLAVSGSGVDGFVAVQRTLDHDNDEPACTAGSGTALPAPSAQSPPPRKARKPLAVEPPGRAEARDLLPFAQGDAFALCGFDNIGGCRHWFVRARGSSRGPKQAVRHDLYGAVERQFYRLIPENLESFELIQTGTAAEYAVPDRAARGHLRPLACERAVSLEVLGRGMADLWFSVATCNQAALIRSLAQEFLDSQANRDNQASPDLPQADRIRYGIGSAHDTLADGSEVFYLFEDTISGDTGVPCKFAIHVDAKRTRAIIVMGVDMAMMASPAQLAGNPLHEKPEAILRELVVRIAHDPDSAR